MKILFYNNFTDPLKTFEFYQKGLQLKVVLFIKFKKYLKIHLNTGCLLTLFLLFTCWYRNVFINLSLKFFQKVYRIFITNTSHITYLLIDQFCQSVITLSISHRPMNSCRLLTDWYATFFIYT